MKQKYHSLIDKVYSTENLYKSWEQVKANKGAPGVDNITISMFEKTLLWFITILHHLLQKGRYKPRPVKRVMIPKPNGDKRPLGIPTVRDRVVQTALRNVLEPIFERIFLDCSYGFRPNRNCHQAIEKIQEYIGNGYRYVIDADLKSYFDTIDHEILIDMVAEEVADGRVLQLIRDMLKSGVLHGDIFEKTTKGTPQGGVISPLLANIYLHHFDKAMTNRGFKIVRYADDFVILCRTRNEVNRAKKVMQRVVEGELKLTIHPTKTRVRTVEQGFSFLGFDIYQTKTVPQKAKVMKFKDKVRELTRRAQPIKTKDIIARLNKTIIGWGNYFKIGNVKSLFRTLDGWIRMRVRSFIKKGKSRNHNWQIPNKCLFGLGMRTLYNLTL